MVRVAAVRPSAAIEGGRIVLDVEQFSLRDPQLPDVRIGQAPARVAYASPTRIALIVPAAVEGGRQPIRISGGADAAPYVDIGTPLATGLHQVDNPVFDEEGNLFVTYSGTRGQQVPVSIFRVRPSGTRETFSSGIVNPTSMAFGPDGRLYVSSRFEGTIYRVGRDGGVETFATDLGVACGLAFDRDGMLFVGDRSGTVFRVDRDGRAAQFSTLPSSVAAFHLAISPDGELYVTAPTFSTNDAVYRVDHGGRAEVYCGGFGRPQGLAFDRSGTLYVVEALAGVSGLYRLNGGAPELVVSGPGLVGAAFGPGGELVVTSNDTAYRIS